jgi:hypothetical protein
MRRVKLTRQGVRDLNGPRFDGTGYNGHKSASCAHHKAPDITPRHTLIKTVTDARGFPKDIRYDCCSICGDQLGEVDR